MPLLASCGLPAMTRVPGLKPRTFACLIAVGAGAFLYRLPFPPFDHAWVAWFSLVPLLLVVYRQPSAKAFLCGAAYGVACCYGTAASWAPQALARFFEIPFVVAALGLLAFCVLFWGTVFGIFAAGAARLLGSRRPLLGTLATAALWVATELLRGRIFEQPWVLLGYSQHLHVALIQISALTGVYGVSFLLALGNAAIAEAVMRRGETGGVLDRFGALAFTGALVAVVWFGGGLVVRRGLPAPTQLVAVVQTNVPPAVHWTRAFTDYQVMDHTRVTDELVPMRDVALIVWPENAVPRYLEGEPALAALLGALAGRHGSDLLFGAPRFADGRTYNSVRLITAGGRNGGHYDKQRLVFVAETNPLRPAWTEQPSDNPRQFAAGDGPGVLQSFVPLGVSICHEILFPELASRAVYAGATLLVSLSNDGWLDPGTGVASQQHFAMAGFRAVETHRYLVRATTTGISGVIDPLGRVVASLDVGVRGALVTPVAGLSVLTPYARLGDVFALGCVIVAAAALLGRRISGGPLRREGLVRGSPRACHRTRWRGSPSAG
jgi:apolipoprotein N-acyltransferase